MKKPRSDSKLLNLPEDQTDLLVGWLIGGMTYEAARKRIKEEFGIEVKANATMSDFWEKVCSLRLLKTRSGKAGRPTRIDPGPMEVLKAKIIELQAAPWVKVKEALSLFQLFLKVRDQEAEELKLNLALAKVEMAELATPILKNPHLSADEKIIGLNKVFRIDPK